MDSFEYKLVRKKQFTIVGIEGNQNVNYDKLSEKLRNNYSKITQLLIPYSCQVVWSIDHKQGLYDTFMGFVVKSTEKVDETFKVCQLPSNDYAVFEFSGKVDAFIHFLGSIYTQWLPHSDFEHHAEDFTHLHFSKQEDITINSRVLKEAPTNSWEIWIPIKEAKENR